MGTQEAATIHESIAQKYRKVAVSPEGLFRYPTGEQSAKGLGYPAEFLPTIPPGVRERFVGVGNPFALGPIHQGEAILDLGCGVGFDAFIAAQLVGPTGRVVGIDLSSEMLAVAEAGLKEADLSNVEFRLAQVEDLPFPDESFDAALSNGVLNLIPDKPQALREILRVLRPGGRLQACDIGLVGDRVPPDKAQWSDWIAGAVTRKVFLAMLEGAGFTEARLVGTGEYRTSGHTQATYYTARKPPQVSR